MASERPPRHVCAERVRDRIRAGERLSDAMLAWVGPSDRLALMDSIRDVLGCGVVTWEQHPRTVRQNLAVFDKALSIDRAALALKRQKATTHKAVQMRELGIGIHDYLPSWEALY